MIETPPTKDTKPDDNGVAFVIILLVGAFIGGLAFILYPILWLAEQFTIIGGADFGRSPWVVVHLIHAAAVLLPALVGMAVAKAHAVRGVYRLWALAGLFILVTIPVQLVEASQALLAALAQIVCTAAFLVLLLVLRRRGERHSGSEGGSLWPALLAAALVSWPWVLWGALGSWLDTVLNLIAAGLLGLAAGIALNRTLSGHTDSTNERPSLPFGIAGFAAGVALVTMGAAFGHNGQQLILMCLMAGLGWLVAVIARQRPLMETSFRWRPASLLVGLVTATPLLFVDPEELILILNLGSRDVGYYAFYATMLGLGLGLFLGLLGWLMGRGTTDRRRVVMIASLAAWAGVIILYLAVGQPGWHGERLYVILNDQADLSAATPNPDPITRRTEVYETLVRHADTTQGGLRQALDRVGIDYRPYYLVNSLEVDAGPLVRLWLESRPEVDRVLNSPELRPLPEPPPMARGSYSAPTEPQWNLVDIGAPQVWADFGALGQGIIIGQSDSGVDGSHPELQEQYRGRASGNPPGNDYNWLDLWNGTTEPVDLGGHGTHTLGTVLGRTVGVAPDAEWIGCVNLARNLGNAPRYLDCLQFLLAPYPQAGDALHDGRPELGANVLNNSWGCPPIEGCDPAALLPAVRALRAAGVFVVASAGNDGSACGTINAPLSLYDEVFTVGALDEFGEVAMFSSRGPVTVDGSDRTKPDVVAPGVGVLSAMPGGTYGYNDGTSMAGPHVAGVVALLWSAVPSLVGDIDRTERILTETAQPVSIPPSDCGDSSQRPNNTAGYGLVDAYAAVARALDSAD